MKRRGRSRTGANIDHAFDELVPGELRHLSRIHWTPVDVAVRAASLLCTSAETRVLDVGAGAGKVCAVGALSGVGVWCGVEHHQSLVRAANRLAYQLGVSQRTIFLHADAFSLDWSEFDALYLYNPFELAFAPHGTGTEHQARDQRYQAQRATERLGRLRRGTRVVTFNGFGGDMPPSFRLLYHEHIKGHDLDLSMWIQTADPRLAWGTS